MGVDYHLQLVDMVFLVHSRRVLDRVEAGGDVTSLVPVLEEARARLPDDPTHCPDCSVHARILDRLTRTLRAHTGRIPAPIATETRDALVFASIEWRCGLDPDVLISEGELGALLLRHSAFIEGLVTLSESPGGEQINFSLREGDSRSALDLLMAEPAALSHVGHVFAPEVLARLARELGRIGKPVDPRIAQQLDDLRAIVALASTRANLRLLLTST